MAFNDSLSDMLARIKNAHKARKSITSCYKSNLNMNVLSVLKDEGYIRDFKDVEVRKGIILFKLILNITMVLLLSKISEEYQNQELEFILKFQIYLKHMVGWAYQFYPPQWV